MKAAVGERIAVFLLQSAGARPAIRDARIIASPATPEIQALAAYWESKRQGRMAPRRADIDPGDIRSHMPNLLLLDVLPDGDYRYRLVGTALAAGPGRNATGRRISEVFGDQPEVVRLFTARLDQVVASRAPLFSEGKVYWDGDDGKLRHFESGSFPLSEDGETVNIVLLELLTYWPR
ncbi:MAG: PAS domain-containing protein [Rhodospirillales bacterium]|nr:PAS domain-containing protein [Rhodospirillales bacterium]